MYEPKEIVNMLATLAFFTYFLYLVRKGFCKQIPTVWLYGVMFITLSNIATVAEGFIWYNIFNLFEHSFFTLACLLFLIGAIKIVPEISDKP
jgi:hypothetical protein